MSRARFQLESPLSILFDILFLAINLFTGTDNQFFYTAVSNGEVQTKQTKNKHKQTSSVQCLHLTINRTLPLTEINFCIRFFLSASP